MEMINAKSKEELVEMIYSQRVHIAKIETDLEREREQVQEIVDAVLPIARDIKESKGLFKVFKIAKLAVVLVEYILDWTKRTKKSAK